MKGAGVSRRPSIIVVRRSDVAVDLVLGLADLALTLALDPALSQFTPPPPPARAPHGVHPESTFTWFTFQYTICATESLSKSRLQEWVERASARTRRCPAASITTSASRWPGCRRPPPYLLHDVEGYAHDEIATMMSIAPGTVRAQLHRAR